MGGLGVRAIRLLYTDLHGVARGKDIPIGHFGGMCEEGVTFCAAVMGTDLGTHRSSAARSATSTSRSSPTSTRCGRAVAAGGGVVPRRGLDARRLGALAVMPAGAARRVVDEYAARGLTPIVAPELEFFLAERDPSAENGLRRYVDELSRVYTVGAVSDPREIVLKMLLGATTSACRRSPRTTSS